MGTLNQELIRVKAALPLMQRAWLYVKDNPGSIPSKVASALNHDVGHVSSIMCVAHQRGMLTRVAVDDPRIKGKPFAYSVPTRMRDYELLPTPKIQSVMARPRVTEITPTLAPVQRKDPLALIDALTIAEARALYAKLHKMFS